MIAKKNAVRKLTLNTETLRRLASDDLKRAVGGVSSAATCWGICTMGVRKPQPTNQ